MTNFLFLLFCISFFSLSAHEKMIDSCEREGTIYFFDSRKHYCGQTYFIDLGKDTICVQSSELSFHPKILPLKVQLSLGNKDENMSKTCSSQFPYFQLYCIE